MEAKKRRGGFFLIITFAVLIAAMVSLYFKIQYDTENPIEVTVKDGVSSSEKFTISTKVPKEWINSEGTLAQTTGAQYDTTIENHSGYDLVNWNITIKVPTEERIRVDSYWNGDYKYDFDTKSIKFVPGEEVKIIQADGADTFGAIVISPEKMEFTDYKFEGFIERTIYSYAFFWFLVIASVVWATSVIAYIIAKHREKTFQRYRETTDELVNEAMTTFANMIDAKDPNTKGHSTRVSFYAMKIAEKLGFSSEDTKRVGYIGLMHDSGKIGVADAILTKPDKLTKEEFRAMQNHTTYGGKALKDFKAIPGIQDGALYHHERYDGKGYPQGLAGEEIPLIGRIICVADALDAMNSDRCYRSRLSSETIISELKNNRGTQFDPKVVDVLLDMIEKGEIILNVELD